MTMQFSRNSRILRLALGILLASVFLSTAALAAKIGGGLDKQMASASAADQLEVIVTFNTETVTADQIAGIKASGITQGIAMQSLPIVGVLATPAQITSLASRSDVLSLWANRKLKYFNHEATAVTGVQRLQSDPILIKRNNGLPYSGKGITVEVNDSGIDATHADLQFGPHVVQNVQGATNLHALSDLAPITFLENQPDTDTAGHGTHVAGSVGGNGAKSAGKYAGAAPGANLVGYGSGLVIFVLDGVGGFDYAISHQAQYGVRVITNSFGVEDPTFDPADPLNVASYRAFKKGIVVLFAAGNSGPGVDTLNPYAKAPWVVGVAAGDKQGHLTDFSSRGLAGDTSTFTINGESWTLLNQPTITAPGRFIISTRATGETNSLIAGDAGPQEDANRIEPAFLPFYTVLTGTSQATPHVTGIVALMLEANPSLGPLDVKKILQQTATNMPGRATWEAGAGYVNAYAAVDKAGAATHNYGGTVNALRTFNSNAVVNTSKTNFSIDYNPVASLSASNNRFTFNVPEGTSQIAVGAQCRGVQNGVQDTGNAIDMFLIAPDGTETESGVPIAFTVFTGRSAVVDNPVSGTWTVLLRALVQTNGVDVSTVPETTQGIIYQTQNKGFNGLNDIAGNLAASSIQLAVANRLMDGRPGGTFNPNSNLVRIDMANYLTMGNEVRQFLPVDGSSTFSDVSLSRKAFAESAAAHGAALKDMFHTFRGVMLPTGTNTFNPNGNVRRYELAYSLVQSLGLESQALQLNGQQPSAVFNGQRVPIDDASNIPAGFEGYVQLALDLNLLNASFSVTQGPFDLQPVVHATFQPTRNVTRAEYAVAATRWLSASNQQ